MVRKVLIRISGIAYILLASSFVSAIDAESKSETTITADKTNIPEDQPEQTSSVIENSAKDKLNDNSDLNYMITFRAIHGRKNNHFMGPRNSSAIVVNPVFTVGNFTLDGDFYYGRQINQERVLTNIPPRNAIKPAQRSAFDEDWESEDHTLQNAIKKFSHDNIQEPHFYRNYLRMMYEDKANNYRIVVGDTAVRNIIGFQNSFSGAGISIFRKNGNGNVINAQSPLVFLRATKVECKLGDEVIACFDEIPPGQYNINDLPLEARLAGAELEITDQIGRVEEFSIDYFSGYNHLKKGEDDFDITCAFRHKWKKEDPNRIRYFSKPRLSSNYRYGLTDDITFAVGAQAVSRAVIFDGNVIFNTSYGKISPNVGISHVNYSKYERTDHGKSTTDNTVYSIDRNKRTAFGAGIFYALPQNSAGIYWEIFAGLKGKGFSDLRINSENYELNNAFINKCFPDDYKSCYKNSMVEETSKQFTTRLYTDPISGFVPLFVYSGNWSNFEKSRQFTIGLTKSILGCTFTLTWGITYNTFTNSDLFEKQKNRRVILACRVPLNKEFEVSANYGAYDGENTAYASAAYTPERVQGLEICAERTKFMSKDNFPLIDIKYANEYFDVHAQQNTFNFNRHSDNYIHSTQQRLYVGTSITNDGLKCNKSGGFNIIKTANPEKENPSGDEEEKEYFLEELEKRP